MHIYALLYIPFHYACYIVFGVFWRLGFLLLRLASYIFTVLLYSIPPLEDRKRVVVVGGGFAGSGVAQNLEQYFHVTLIDSKDYFEFTPSVLRTIVEPGHIKRIQVMHNHYLKLATVIQKEVIRVDPDKVILDDREVPFDYLVLTSGSSYSPPFKESKLIGATRGSALRESNYTLRKAQAVLIIGGGLVGVELAAEIAVHYPKKQVILVHAQPYLMGRFPKKAIKYSTDFLVRHKVRIVYNERIISHRMQTFVTDQGTEIAADVAFLCTGIAPNSNYLRDNFSDAIAGNGYVCVNDHMQLSGALTYSNIFVAGDVVDTKEEKLAQGAEYMSNTIANNIFYMSRGKTLQRYHSPFVWPVVVSLGKYHAVFIYGQWCLTGPIPALLKEAIEWKTLVRYR